MCETNKPSRSTELLDVECEEDRLDRLRSSLEKLNRNSTNRNIISPPLNFDFRNRTPHAINPPTELLSRIQAFLPAFEASNAILAQRAQADPKSVDIEHIDEGMDRYIEMDLGLGVFEDRKHANLNKKQRATSDSDSSISASEETYADSDTDSTSSDEIITAFKPIRPIKPLPRRSLANRPGIALLREHR